VAWRALCPRMSPSQLFLSAYNNDRSTETVKVLLAPWTILKTRYHSQTASQGCCLTYVCLFSRSCQGVGKYCITAVFGTGATHVSHTVSWNRFKLPHLPEIHIALQDIHEWMHGSIICQQPLRQLSSASLAPRQLLHVYTISSPGSRHAQLLENQMPRQESSAFISTSAQFLAVRASGTHILVLCPSLPN
jgi:hypothetical protein